MHLTYESLTTVTFTLEVDFLGNATWRRHQTSAVPAGGYSHHGFLPGFSTHRAKMTADTSRTATAYSIYT